VARTSTREENFGGPESEMMGGHNKQTEGKG